MITPKKQEFTPIKGVDVREPQSEGASSQLINASYNSEIKSWSNDLGYERYFPGKTTFSPFATTPVNSIYNFERHNGAQQWLLHEQGGTLKYVEGSSGGAVVTLTSGRTVPAPGEPGTFYNVFSRYCVITNGLDGPLKYRGYSQLQPLGWDRKPNPPTPVSLAPNPNSNNLRLQSQPATVTLSTVNSPLGATLFGSEDTQGLGDPTSNAANKYRWKVTLINENGSESPISSESSTLKWTTTTDSYGNNNSMVCMLTDLPTGPKGTVGRRLYRTKNLSNASDGNYYFVAYIPNNKTTVFFDDISDSELGSQAPNDADSIAFPASQCRYSATFKSCLFIDGGQTDGTKLFYSEPLQLDTYKASSILDLGTRKGGFITGLYTYYNQLLVFRDSAIDMVRGDAASGFQLVPFAQGIGTKSPHTITFVPGLGVLFLGNDGVYVISGGLDGGSTLSITNISQGIGTILEKRSIDVLGQACAAYSPKSKEWQCYFPGKGSDVDIMGIVYHIEGGYWSQRTGFPVGCCTTDFDGNVIFGHNTGYSGETPPGSKKESGLFVISRRHACGTVWGSIPNPQGGQTPVLLDDDPCDFSWRSKWHDFGYPGIKKFIKYVYIYAAGRGSNKVSLSYYKDHTWQTETVHPDQEWQWDDMKNQPYYAAIADDYSAILGTSRWQDKVITPIRFDISNKAVTDFAFEIKTQNPVEFIGYAVEYEVNGTQTIGGKR